MANATASSECLIASLPGVNVSASSLTLDVGGLDDRPPFVDLGLVEGSERFRRLLLARRNLLPEIGEPRADRRIGERLDHRGVELGDDVLRRALAARTARTRPAM